MPNGICSTKNLSLKMRCIKLSWTLICIRIIQPRLNLVLINTKKRTCYLIDCAVSVDHRVKIKESVTIDKYLDLARKLKKQWNMLTAISIVVGTLGTVPEGLEKRWRTGKKGRIETIQIIAVLISARILRRILETRGDLLSLRFQ